MTRKQKIQQGILKIGDVKAKKAPKARKAPTALKKEIKPKNETKKVEVDGNEQ